MTPATREQNDLLGFIERTIAERGLAPSFREMERAMDKRSTAGVHRMVLGLEARGIIRRIPNQPRAIEVVPPGERKVVEGDVSPLRGILRPDQIDWLRRQAHLEGVKPLVLLREIVGDQMEAGRS